MPMGTMPDARLSALPFTARPPVRPRDGIPRIRARRSRRSAPYPREKSQSRTPECLPLSCPDARTSAAGSLRSEEQTGCRAVRRTCRICPRSPQDVHLREPRRIRAGSKLRPRFRASGISSRSQAVYIPDEILSDLRKVQPRLSQGACQGGAARNSTRRARGSCPRGKPPRIRATSMR